MPAVLICVKRLNFNESAPTAGNVYRVLYDATVVALINNYTRRVVEPHSQVRRRRRRRDEQLKKPGSRETRNLLSSISVAEIDKARCIISLVGR